jgi:carboxyl-terminal processing protease
MMRRMSIRGRVALAAAFSVASGAYGWSWAADLAGPSPYDRVVTRQITKLMEQEHLTKHPLDDEISQRFMDQYLKALDPSKMYFLQADIDEFRQKRNDLDDLVKEGDTEFAFEVFDRYLQRVKERLVDIDELLAMDHDFTVDEEMVIDPDAATYAHDAAEARDKWRKRIKFDLLMQKEDKVEDKEARDKLTRRYRSRAKQWERFKREQVMEIYLTSLTTSFDPHTSYMGPHTLAEFEIDMSLKLEGIGALLQYEDGYTVVKEIVPGGPADLDGRIKPKDTILGVGQGEGGEIEDVVEMNLTDVVDKIRGKGGSIVRLQVRPAAGGESVIYDLKRAKIEMKSSEARGEVITEMRDGREYKVGVINLPSFYRDMNRASQRTDFKSTTRDVRVLIDDFKKQGVEAVIVDLRRNGGGSLDEAIDLTGLFIKSGPVVQVKDSAGTIESLDDEDTSIAWDGPLVVLTSKLSASASEIFAGAIQDYGRGIVIGDPTTHGKGTVQSLLDLSRQVFRIPNAAKLGALKITFQQFYRPNGDSTQNRGVVSDVALPSVISQLDIGESDLDFAREFNQVPAARYQRLGLVNDAVLTELRNRSAARIEGSEDFQRVKRNIAKYLERKDRKTITLNEEKYLAEQAEVNRENEEQKAIEEQSTYNRPIVDRDFYFNEALAIALDYMNLSSKVAQK